MISVYVIDARELLRRGLREAIAATTDLTLVGEAATPSAALPAVALLAPDVVVVDFDDDDDAVLRFCRLVSAPPSSIPVLVSMRSFDRTRAGEAVLAGAAGHIDLSRSAADAITRIRDTHGTPPELGTEVIGDLFDRVRMGQASSRHPLAELTAREREIISLLAEGLDNRSIGEILHLSPKTVKNYVSAILKKLGMASRTEAAVFAAREAARAQA